MYATLKPRNGTLIPPLSLSNPSYLTLFCREGGETKNIWLKYPSPSNIHLIKVLKKLYEIFSGVWHDLGYSWEDLKDWMTARHIPAMQIIHVEVKFYHWYQIGKDSNLRSCHFQSCRPVTHSMLSGDGWLVSASNWKIGHYNRSDRFAIELLGLDSSFCSGG